MDSVDAVVFLSDHCLPVSASELVASLDLLSSPVTPVDVVLKYGHSIRVFDGFREYNLKVR